MFQEHIETVIPGIGRAVLVVLGPRKGNKGELQGLKDGACLVKIKDKEILLQYNEVCKIHSESK